MSGAARRVQLEAAFLLHHYPWRDSSRILEFFTRTHGRVSVFARAARRGGSSLPAALQPFGELLVSWSARGEAGQLTGAERVHTPSFLAGDRLMSGFYANELLKEIGTAARLDLKRHFGRPVHLELWVKVREGWSDDENALRKFGFET